MRDNLRHSASAEKEQSCATRGKQQGRRLWDSAAHNIARGDFKRHSSASAASGESERILIEQSHPEPPASSGPPRVRLRNVLGKTAARHTVAEFIDFPKEVVASAKRAKEIHIILDNLSAHKTKAAEEFSEGHPKVRFHFTPTYSSWLNQVEIWFARIERDVIAWGVFTSVADLARKLRKYIRAYGKSAKPFRWTCTDTARRVRS